MFRMLFGICDIFNVFRAHPATAEQIKSVIMLNHFLQPAEKDLSLTAHFRYCRHKHSAWFPNSKNIFVVLQYCCRPQFQLMMLHLAADKCFLSPMLYLFPISSAAAASVPSWFSLLVGCNRLLIVSWRREGGGAHSWDNPSGSQSSPHISPTSPARR